MKAAGPESAPRMTLRVYRVDRYGTCIAEVSSCEVRVGERPPEFNSMAFPPCECPRCHAERQHDQAQTEAVLQRRAVRQRLP